MPTMDLYILGRVLPKFHRSGKRVRSIREGLAIENAGWLRDKICLLLVLWRGGPLHGPLWCDLTFTYAWPKKIPMRDRTKTIPKDTEPDRDNLEKQVFDALESAGVFAKSDAQVCGGPTMKLWGGEDSVHIRLCTWDERGDA